MGVLADTFFRGGGTFEVVEDGDARHLFAVEGGGLSLNSFGFGEEVWEQFVNEVDELSFVLEESEAVCCLFLHYLL